MHCIAEALNIAVDPYQVMHCIEGALSIAVDLYQPMHCIAEALNIAVDPYYTLLMHCIAVLSPLTLTLMPLIAVLG